MLIGLSFGKHSIKKYYNYNYKHQYSFIFKIRFVTLKGVCMHFTCNENRALLSI